MLKVAYPNADPLCVLPPPSKQEVNENIPAAIAANPKALSFFIFYCSLILYCLLFICSCSKTETETRLQIHIKRFLGTDRLDIASIIEIIAGSHLRIDT